MKIWGFTFGKSHPRIRVTGVLLSAVLALLAGGTGQALAADFYVGGARASDANPGTASEPFAAIQAAANVAMPGDVVKIRDGIYCETVVPAHSGTPGNPIVFEADDGAEPAISGADLLTGANWQPTQHAIQVPGNHIYEATVRLPVTGYADESTGTTDLLANQIFVRSKMMPEARWPKMVDTDDPMNHSGMRMRPGPRSLTGWGITFGSGDNPTNTLSDSEIPAIPGGWAGGRIKIYTKYLPNDNPIVSSAPGQISWQPQDLDSGHQILTKEYSDHGSFNYHLFGVLGALSAENEWFYDGTKLYLWAPGGGVPSDVEYKARNHGFDLTGRSHITIKGLNFFACEIPTNGNSIWPSNVRNWPGVVNNGDHPTTGVVPAPSNNIIVDTCRFKYPNHYQTIVKPEDGGSLQRELSELRLAQNNNISASRFHETGIRFTGDNCVFRNSVVSHAAGQQSKEAPGLIVAPLNDLTHDARAGAFPNAYFVAGLDVFGRALASYGHPRAAEVQAVAKRMSADVTVAFARGSVNSPVVQLADGTWSNYVPCDATTPRRLLDLWYPTDVDAGPLHLSRLAAIDPCGWLTTAMLHDHEDNLFLNQWGMANEPVYNQQATAYLSRDEPKAAIRAFYSMMACAFSRHQLTPLEHRWAWGQYYMPPSTDGAWFELYRNMLVREVDDDTLLLLQATPRKWLEHGKKMTVERAPTYYGQLSMSVRSQTDAGKIMAHIDMPRRSQPGELRVRFRHPDGQAIRSVTVNGEPHEDFDTSEEWVRITRPSRGHYTIEVSY